MSLLVEQETEEFPESANCQKVMGSVCSGMYSGKENLELIKWCLRVLNMLSESFSVNKTVMDYAYKWFLDKEGGFELCLHSLSNHSIVDIGDEIVTLISHFVNTAENPEERLVSLYKDRFHKYYNSPMIYLAAITEMLPYIIPKHRESLI